MQEVVAVLPGAAARGAIVLVAALLAIKGEKISEGELDRMAKLIDAAKKEGR